MHRAAIGMSVAALVTAAAATACNTSSLTRRELVVYFAPTATAQQHAAALSACTGVAPHTTPEPIVAGRYVADRVGNVRFRIDRADDHDLSLLLGCLRKQPGVVGYSIPD